MAQVVLQNVSKRFGGVTAVQDLSLTVADHEFVVLVGPSGCGKSTTLRMIAGLEDLTSGEIRIGERVVNHLPPRDRDISMVFQNYALYQHMSVYDNLAFGLRNRKAPEADIDREIQRTARLLGIGELLARRPRQLSGGQQQRVALGRCIVRNPSVFLFDEPLSNLDAQLRSQMRVELKELRLRVPTTSIFVTHDQVEAMTLGDRIVVMRDGLVQQVGTPLQVYRQPRTRFVAQFIGSPAMNFFSAALAEAPAGVELSLGGQRVGVDGARGAALRPHVGQSIVVGLRPEHLALAAEGSAAPRGALVLRGEVRVTEQLGAEQVVDVQVVDVHGQGGGVQDGKIRVARVNPDAPLRPGERVTLVAAPEALHFFAAESGLSLLLP